MKKIKKLIVSKKWWLILGLGLVLGLGLGWRVRAKKAIQREKEIETAKVERKDLRKVVILSGRVDAHEKVTLKFQTSGLLSWVGVKEGDWVKKYQAIASLDKRSLKKSLEKEMYDYSSERHDFEQGEDDYESVDRWFELSDEVKRILDKNQNDLNKVVLDVELADLTVRLATITTPIEGIVTLIESPYPGVNITPATAEFRIVNPATVYFYAEADEEEVVDLKGGMAAVIILDAYSRQEFLGVIKRVSFSPVGSGTSPSYKVEVDLIDFNNPDLFLRMEMEGEVEISVDCAIGILSIPLDALRGKKEDWVYVINSLGEKQKRLVVTGLKTDNEIEIVEGLSEGESVLID